jgi:hypothetical protein
MSTEGFSSSAVADASPAYRFPAERHSTKMFSPGLRPKQRFGGWPTDGDVVRD